MDLIYLRPLFLHLSGTSEQNVEYPLDQVAVVLCALFVMMSILELELTSHKLKQKYCNLKSMLYDIQKIQCQF